MRMKSTKRIALNPYLLAKPPCHTKLVDVDTVSRIPNLNQNVTGQDEVSQYTSDQLCPHQPVTRSPQLPWTVSLAPLPMRIGSVFETSCGLRQGQNKPRTWVCLSELNAFSRNLQVTKPHSAHELRSFNRSCLGSFQWCTVVSTYKVHHKTTELKKLKVL